MSGKIFFRTETASWKIAARLVASTILDAAAAAFKAIVNRRSVDALASWDDRMLQDIGLTRSDLDGALAQPWHRDPSRELMVRRLENRVRRRSAGHVGDVRQNGGTRAAKSEPECVAPRFGNSAKELN